MQPLPYDVSEAMVQCFGKCFHYKDVMDAFLTNAGVKRSLMLQHKPEAKFVWSRRVLNTLGETEEGCLVQRRILGELCNLRNLPDAGVENRDAGLEALRNLKTLALEQDLIARKQKKTQVDRAKIAAEREKIVQERATRLAKLREQFVQAVMNPDRQEAGYTLEDILRELFSLSDIEYKKSYRTSTQQIDGHFNFQAFDYLVEAKWRKDQPNESEIGAFQRKVRTKFDSTRGLFVSIPGYRQEVIEKFCGEGANIILMDGEHLTQILEGRYELQDVLRRMVEMAAQRGLVHIRLVD